MVTGRPGKTLRYSANLSMLYADLPVLDRPAAAADAGFSFVESWWPFSSSVPPAGEIDAFCRSLDSAGVGLVALNLDAGDTAHGERGLLSYPQLAERVSANLRAALPFLERSGCRIVNALYGNRLVGQDPVEQDRIALARLIEVADAAAQVGAEVVVETLNTRDSPDFPLTDIAATVRLVTRAIERSRHGNVGLLLDVYHLATMGADPVAAIRSNSALIRHVQFADAPGRGRPGTGRIDFDAIERALLDVGYAGYIGLEYAPARTIDTHRAAREGDIA